MAILRSDRSSELEGYPPADPDAPSPEAVRDLIAGEAEGDPGPLALRRMGGGASRQVYLIEALSGVGMRRWVLRRVPPGAGSFLALQTEYAVLEQASAAGVPVPAPLFFEPEGGRLGSAGFVMGYVEGESIGTRILRRRHYHEARRRLPDELAEALAQIHSIPFTGLSVLPRPSNPDPAIEACELWESVIDQVGEPLPAVEAALRRLRATAPPPPQRRCLVHGDFRLGNFLIAPTGLRAVLDWELAHIGDPAEDIAWLSIRAWRFGEVQNAIGGLTSLEAFLHEYAAAGREPPDSERLRWWAVLGNVKWAVICAMQAHDHLTGRRRSLELASLGRRAAEAESEALRLLAEPRGRL